MNGFGTSFIINSVVIYPVVKWILGNESRWPKAATRKSLTILFLAIMGVASVAVDLLQILENRNLFKILQVSRSSDDKDIRKAYQRLAKEYHPDKNRDDPLAEQRFMEMKEAYDVLSNPTLRIVYDRWGYDGINTANRGENVLYIGLLQMGIMYTIWFTITILVTAPTSNTNSRSISLSGLALIVAVDLGLKTSTIMFTIPFISYLAIYQISSLLITLYPTFIGGTITYQTFTYLDPVDRNWILLSRVIEQQEQIIESFTKLENELRITNKNDAIQTVVSSIGESTANLPRNLIAKIGRHHNTNHAQQTETNKGMAKWMFILALSIIYQYIIR